MSEGSLYTSCVAVAVALSFAGCQNCTADQENNLEDQGTSAGPCYPLPDLRDASPNSSSTDGTAAFVITSLRFGDLAAGLNLDCINSPSGCRDDLCREGPDDGAEGVDNRLGPLALRISKLAGSDLQAEMSEAVAREDHPLLLRVTGSTHLADGGATAIELEFGLDADGDPSDLHSGRAKVRSDPAGPSKTPSRFSPVTIRDGVVTAGPGRDWMPLFWTRGQIAAVPVEVAYLRFRVLEAPSQGEPPIGGRIGEGLLAGAIRPANLSKAILDMDRRTAQVLTRLGPVVRALIRQQADLDLVPPGVTTTPCSADRECSPGQHCRDGWCQEPEARHDTISFAIAFSAVSVTE